MIQIDETKTHSITPEKIPVERRETPQRAPKNPLQPKDHHHLDIIDTEDSTIIGFHSGSQKRSGLKLALWTWFSATIDGLVLVSVCCFFAVLFSFLMKTSPSSMVSLFLKNQNLSRSLATLFLMSGWSYLIFMRAFMGASIGEWTCGLRLGEPIQRFKASYFLKVTLRTSVILVTGVVTLPLLSLLFSRDLAGDISGVKIYSMQ